MDELKKTDQDIYDLIQKEAKREKEKIRLIPSENYVSAAVLEATGSILTNKYSEGYPGKRYYEGQQFVDQVEVIARERAERLFGADHANVQPYSGSPANLAIYYALLEPGDTIMGLALPMGGHLTHGWKVSATSHFWRAAQYSVDPTTELFDFSEIRKLAIKEKPKMIVAGATAYPRVYDWEKFAEIAKEVGAYFLADTSHVTGLIAAGAHPNPFPFADVMMTTTHKTLRGPRGAMILCQEQYADKIDRAVFPALQGGPHNHTTAGIAVALKEAASDDFKQYGKQIVANAKALAEELLKHGFRLVSGGTDNHLILIDMTAKGLTGKQMSRALDRAGIVTNCNTIPFDKRSPFDPSGVRIGTPAVTSRGMKEGEMKVIGKLMNRVAENIDNEKELEAINKEVMELTSHFPAPGIG